VYSSSRRVRLGDVSRADRLRFDAVARYLQDIARDDSADSALENPMGWVVRRTVIEVAAPPVFQEDLRLTTWCSGIGHRWAERRTSITGAAGGSVEAATLWVHVDLESGRPARLVPGFVPVYGPSAGGRGADPRLGHAPEPPSGVPAQRWALRAADFDVIGHVNNAAYAATVEDAIAERPDLWTGVRVELEYRDPAQPGADPELSVQAVDGGLDLWLRDGDVTHLTAAVRATG
jgi:acyl-ACP thioesterase